MKYILLFLILAAPARAAQLDLTLRSAEDGALAVSGPYRAALAAVEAAQRSAAASGVALAPRVALEGSLKYSEVVTAMKIGAMTRKLGDNWNYSVGPSAYYTLYDGGALRGGYEAALANAASKRAEAEQLRRQALLKARGAYFKMQLALEKVYLIGENLQLSLSQLKDIELGVKAGSRSRLDGLRVRQEFTARRRDLLRARNELSAALRDLAFEAGLEFKEDVALPLDARMAGRDYGGAAGGLYIKAESYEAMLNRLSPAMDRPADPALPSVAAYDSAAAAWRSYAAASRAERSPRLNLGARSSVDYPNGPNLYSFMQNSASLSLSLPLFESGRTEEKRREGEANARTALERRSEAERTAARDFAAARDACRALLAEQEINSEAVSEASEAARLAYDAYKAGGGTWLEVESSNLKELQAKTTAATTNAEILLKLSQLDSLSAQQQR